MKIIKEIEIKIENLKDYEKYAGPKESDQWKDDHSAKEFARKVVNGEFEQDMKELFGENLVIDKAYPEKVVEFDTYGEGRHHDLACIAQLNGKKIVICVEAKATETFGDKTVGEYYDDTINTKSNVPDRIKCICKLLWDSDQLDAQIRKIQYQLFPAMAGTIDYGYQNKSSRIYFVVYQLETDKTTKEQIISHKEAVNNFLLKFGPYKKIEDKENNKIVKLREDKEWYLAYVQRKKSKSE